jgi:hypothetical protein
MIAPEATRRRLGSGTSPNFRRRIVHGRHLHPARMLLSPLLALLATPESVLAQGSISAPNRPAEYRATPNVFFDCSGPITCQPDLHRTEIPWVNWVNNREDADVHILSTRQDLGGGSIRMTVRFQGLGDRAHLSDELAYTSPGTDLMRDRQDGFTRLLKLGLLRHAMEGGLGSGFDLAFSPDASSVTDGSGAALDAAGAQAAHGTTGPSASVRRVTSPTRRAARATA